eukprot:g852.t1
MFEMRTLKRKSSWQSKDQRKRLMNHQKYLKENSGVALRWILFFLCLFFVGIPILFLSGIFVRDSTWPDDTFYTNLIDNEVSVRGDFKQFEKLTQSLHQGNMVVEKEKIEKKIEKKIESDENSLDDEAKAKKGEASLRGINARKDKDDDS